MPNSQFPISGVVYDTDGSTAVEGALCQAFNITKDEASIVVPTNSSGEYMIEIGDLPTQWESSDILIVVTHSNGKTAAARCKIAGVQSTWEQDLYMRVGKNPTTSVLLRGIVCSCHATAATFSIVERDTGNCKMKINVPKDTTISPNLGKGIFFRDGFFVLRAVSETNSETQSAGSSNAIGDTSSNTSYSVVTDISYTSFEVS